MEDMSKGSGGTRATNSSSAHGGGIKIASSISTSYSKAMKSSNDGASVKSRESIKESARGVMENIMPKLQSKYSTLSVEGSTKGYSPSIRIYGDKSSGEYVSFTIGVTNYTKPNTNYNHYGLSIKEPFSKAKGFSNVKDLIKEIETRLK